MTQGRNGGKKRLRPNSPKNKTVPPKKKQRKLAKPVLPAPQHLKPTV